MNQQNDACVVIGAGPNGLAAAIELARARRAVTVFEAAEVAGGGVRSAELTLPGFIHDICSSVYPLGVASPFFRSLPLAQHGLQWLHPDAPLAHPLDDGTAVMLERSLDDTAAGLNEDREAYRRLIEPLVKGWDALSAAVLAPPFAVQHPLVLARFGWYGRRSAVGVARSLFVGERARALLAGVAAHSLMPLTRPFSVASGLVLSAAAHTVGWPFVAGGSQKLADALAGYLRSLGGKVVTGTRIERLEQLPPAAITMCDVTPRQLIRIAGAQLPASYKRLLTNFRYGPGVFKVDWALSSPIPWKAAECARAGTVHVGGTLAEIAAAESEASHGIAPERPFVLLAQASLFDRSRAPAGKHTAWAYCHVPNGSSYDMLTRIEDQIERFAPGFRDCVLARSVMNPRQIEEHDANMIGGDVAGGSMSGLQMFFRPTFRLHRTPVAGLFLCSSSTPPLAGVHGMCGYYAAQTALRAERLRSRRESS